MSNLIGSYLLLSDIHLGHNRTTTDFIVDNLRKFFKKYDKDIKKTDMVVITGDTFDRLLSANSHDARLAYSWLTELLLYCRDNGLKLRILEGTPSHDWKQVKLLDEIVSKGHIDIDFKYVDDIEIEFIRLGDYELSILYIPDEIEETADEVLDRVKEVMKENELDKVDIVWMHGAFKYQLPIKNLDFLHDEKTYNKLTNFTINVGHVHNQSQLEKILCPGSFDRLTFADENDPKGGWIVNLYDDYNVKYKFLENKSAMTFKTIDLTKEDYKKITKILERVKDFANIRLLVDKSDSTVELIKELKFKYPNIHFVIKTVDKDEEVKLTDEEEISKRELFTFKLTKDNIKELVLNELNEEEKNNKLLMEELDLLLKEQ